MAEPDAATFDSALGSSISMHMTGCLANGFTSFRGFSPSVLISSHEAWVASCIEFERAAAVAPDLIRQDAAAQFSNHLQILCNRLHTLPDFQKRLFTGEGGSKLRANIERYHFAQMHAKHKSGTTGIDLFLYASNEAGLLLFYGDVAAARGGWEKQIDAWLHIQQSVKAGERGWSSYVYEGVMIGLSAGVATMMAAGERRSARKYVRHHCATSMLNDPAALAEMTKALHEAPFWWGGGEEATEQKHDGHRYVHESSLMLQIRALIAVLDMDAEEDGDERIGDDASSAGLANGGLRDWLPQPSELLYRAQREFHWYAFMRGIAHPALLCSTLYGKALGEWSTAAQITHRRERRSSKLNAKSKVLLAERAQAES